MHPRQILLGAQGRVSSLPVCDHYSGVEARMRKSLQLQADWIDRCGTCVFDVTLDCEDGAPVGGEHEHALLVTELVQALPAGGRQRVGVRVHAVDHPAFEADVAQIAGALGDRLAYLMVPKVDTVADVERAVRAIDAAGATRLPLHVLVESPLAVHHVFDMAAHPRIESISFGLMDFVSAHGGAIPSTGMGVEGQFSHPLVLRAKMDIASACHAHGKVPSHNVVTEFRDTAALGRAARRAAHELGYTRMWSIHPDQIAPIIEAFSPAADEVERAVEILWAAQAADWGPIAHRGHLHDRASFRYFWHVLERAHHTGLALPSNVLAWLV